LDEVLEEGECTQGEGCDVVASVSPWIHSDVYYIKCYSKYS
jgi:hypothetical protein